MHRELRMKDGLSKLLELKGKLMKLSYQQTLFVLAWISDQRESHANIFTLLSLR